jgi:deoxyribodipyrimidine photo-lyase
VDVAVVLFTRDLRLHDNPALVAAVEAAATVLPLFVLDDGIGGTRYGSAPNRLGFLHESLVDLDASLRRLGGALDVRRGEVVAETVRAGREVGATTVFATADVSAYARARERRLGEALDLRLHDGSFVVPPGEVAPAGKDHYEVFTPYHRAWSLVPPRALLAAPKAIRLPPAAREGLCVDSTQSPLAGTPRGGETAGVERARAWLRSGLDGYGSGGRDDLAADATSRLSPYLHFGCVSARALAVRARERGDAETTDAFVRQLCWRDFYAQLLAARPETQVDDLRPRGDRWVDDPDGLAAWKDGMTGFPLVDAGMRQLRAEGWMHNRARMVTASFLVKDLGIDWREGARHFFDLLVDGDVAQNVGNWQWVAGTGVDTRPNRVFNPTAQLRKLDPEGAYVRRHVPELAGVPVGDLPEPGLLAPSYPRPIVDHGEAVAAFRARRGVA